jgi:hypothetical protein
MSRPAEIEPLKKEDYQTGAYRDPDILGLQRL